MRIGNDYESTRLSILTLNFISNIYRNSTTLASNKIDCHGQGLFCLKLVWLLFNCLLLKGIKDAFLQNPWPQWPSVQLYYRLQHSEQNWELTSGLHLTFTSQSLHWPPEKHNRWIWWNVKRKELKNKGLKLLKRNTNITLFIIKYNPSTDRKSIKTYNFKLTLKVNIINLQPI